MAFSEAWRAYFYPETFSEASGTGVLRNLCGERDPVALARMEYRASTGRALEILQGRVPIRQTFDASHVRAIHHHLFQDIYAWAGTYRTVDMSKGSTDFASASGIDHRLADVHRAVTSTRWRALGHEEFAAAAAAVFAHLNQAHPFREGNGRTSKIFMEQVTQRSRFALDFSRVDPQEWIGASVLSSPFHGRRDVDPAPLAEVFERIVVERRPGMTEAWRRITARAAITRTTTSGLERLGTTRAAGSARVLGEHGRGIGREL